MLQRNMITCHTIALCIMLVPTYVLMSSVTKLKENQCLIDSDIYNKTGAVFFFLILMTILSLLQTCIVQLESRNIGLVAPNL